MGWLWASPSPPKPSSPAQDKAPATPSTTAPNEPSYDPEIQKFLDLFSSESGSKQEPYRAAPSSIASSKPTVSSDSSSTSSSPSPGASSWFSLKASRDRAAPTDSEHLIHAPVRDPLSESLLPTDISCRQAFDLAWSCNSLGGQWNAVYRHGEMRSCSDEWDDFWFCMRTKSYGAAAKAQAIREHYRDREHAKYYAPGRRSSEDIWSPRLEKMPPGAAFNQGIDAPVVSDEEWRRQENERRGEVRRNLGLGSA